MGYILGIEIDSRNMKIACGKTVKDKLYLRKCEIVKFDKEISVDGRITDAGEIEEHLRRFICANKIRSKRVAFLIQGTQIITRYTSLPFVNLKEIEKYLSYTLKNYFPQNISNYVMDYKIMSQDSLDNKSYVLMSAVPQEMLLDYMKISSSLKLKPQFADIHCNCVLRIFQNIVSNDAACFESSIMILCIDWEFINTVILSDNVLQFNRVIRFGANDFSEHDNIDDSSVAIIISELKKYIDYFATSRTKGDEGIKAIYITGLFSGNQVLVNEIEKNISIPVKVFSNNSWVFEKKQSTDISNLLSVLGLIFTYRR